jgi:hypothetical protein
MKPIEIGQSQLAAPLVKVGKHLVGLGMVRMVAEDLPDPVGRFVGAAVIEHPASSAAAQHAVGGSVDQLAGDLGHFMMLAPQLLRAAAGGGGFIEPSQPCQDQRPVIAKLWVERVSGDRAVQSAEGILGMALAQIDRGTLPESQCVVGFQNQGPVERGDSPRQVALSQRDYAQPDVTRRVVRMAGRMGEVGFVRLGVPVIEVQDLGQAEPCRVAGSITTECFLKVTDGDRPIRANPPVDFGLPYEGLGVGRGLASPAVQHRDGLGELEPVHGRSGQGFGDLGVGATPRSVPSSTQQGQGAVGSAGAKVPQPPKAVDRLGRMPLLSGLTQFGRSLIQPSSGQSLAGCLQAEIGSSGPAPGQTERHRAGSQSQAQSQRCRQPAPPRPTRTALPTRVTAHHLEKNFPNVTRNENRTRILDHRISAMSAPHAIGRGPPTAW